MESVPCANSQVKDCLGSLIIAVLGASNYAASLGKKGTSTDISLYDLKRGKDIVTFVEPERYPERLAPLFFAVAMAKKAIVVVEELNSTIGECLVMLQCCNISSGYFILRNYLPRERIETLIKGTCMEKFEFIEDNPTMLREKCLIDASQDSRSGEPEEVTGIVPLDHAFNVRGVGTVGLGTVTSGSIARHATLQVLPAGTTAQVRSIQKQDDEFEAAYEGDRIGLALRNIDSTELGRGTVLTSDPTIKTSKLLDTQAALVKYWPLKLRTGMILHIGHWMQFINGRIEAVTNDGDWHEPLLTLALDKEIVHRPGDHAVLTYLEGGKLRVAGTIRLP
jgi:selenocysteine-specific translation elongation factor